jgi:hypothetical protein
VHTADARFKHSTKAAHLVSSLICAEFFACISRLERAGHLSNSTAATLVQAFEQGPWLRINASPDPQLFAPLAAQARLRGADLWHLGLVLSLQSDLPEIAMLTYDDQLKEAANAAGVLV